MKKLELKDIAAYFPYDVMCKLPNGDVRFIVGSIENAIVLKLNKGKQYSPIHHVRPFLRPMSDIVKEIEVNGKKFIPLLALLKIISTTEHEHKIVDIAFKTYNMCGIISHAFVDYANETSNLGTLIYRFSYDLEFRRFGHFDKTRNIPLGVPFQVDLFDKLNEWHFDYRGLIEQGLAIDINTLSV